MAHPFLLRTRWLTGHLIIVLMVIGMAALSHWQFERRDTRRHHNAEIKAALTGPPLTTFPASGTHDWKAVTLTGHFDSSGTMLQRYPLHEGQSGYYVLTPFVTNAARILVNRGWVPVDIGKSLTAAKSASAETVTIVAWYRHADKGNAHPGVNSVSLPTRTAITEPYLQLQPNHPSVPAGPVVPITIDGPDLGEGPHWSYALQWISFCIIAIGGWITLLYRAWRDEQLPTVNG